MTRTNTHGGARRGSGRKPKPGRKVLGVWLEVETIALLKAAAVERETSLSALANEILKHYLRLPTGWR